MKIIRQTPNPSGAYPSPQDWHSPEIPAGMALWPDELDTADFYAYNGFVVLAVEQVETVIGQQEAEVPGEEDGAPGVELQDVTAVLPTVTAYAPNAEAWEAWTAEHPAPDPLETARAAKLAELSAACNAAIEAGIDLELGGEAVHFDLPLEEQSNIANLFKVVELGGTQYPYQADGGVCRIYSAAEITQIYIATQTLITTQRTYHNALKAYVQTLTSAEELEPIVYGMELPDAYATQMADKLAVAQAQMDDIVARLGGQGNA